MANTTGTKPQFDLYQTLTDQVVSMLEAGTAPWRKPWTAGSAPRNLEGREYRGINTFMLGAAGYASPFWGTFNQIKSHGGSVRKGEKSTLVVYWKMLRVEDKDTGETKTVPMLRFFRVFNLAQTEGVKPTKAMRDHEAATARPADHDPIAAAEAIVTRYTAAGGPTIWDASEAYYLPGTDSIHRPPMERFAKVEDYYSTLFHEIGHSTGHESRLKRDMSGCFGSHDYGREELVAEMTATFLAAEAGIETATIDQNAAYLASWVRTIKADPRAVVVAAGAAQKAADLILGRTAPAADSGADEAAEPAADAVALAA